MEPFITALSPPVSAQTIMINSASINGVPVHASKSLLTDMLRDELNFGGVAVTDWQDIEKLHSYHFVVSVFDCTCNHVARVVTLAQRRLICK